MAACQVAAPGSGGDVQARSVVFDLFGAYVRHFGGEISLQELSALLACFDVPPDSSRVVMSRLAREGWFEVRKRGHASLYRPSAKGWELLDSGLGRIMRSPVSAEWQGTWFMATFSVPEENRASRIRLKTKLTWLGFGQLATSIWISPHDHLGQAEAAFSAEPSARYRLFEASSRGPQSDREIAASSWDLAQLATDYRAFTVRCQSLIAGAATVRGRDAMVSRTELVHDYRKFPFRDPGLPAVLLPEPWPGGQAHQAFLDAFALLATEAMNFYEEIAGRGAG
jgi:phenylacetic acid degradation operon negative regulatory protein